MATGEDQQAGNGAVRRHPGRRSAAALAAAVAGAWALLMPGAASAQQRTWTGGGASASWDDPGNWTGSATQTTPTYIGNIWRFGTGTPSDRLATVMDKDASLETVEFLGVSGHSINGTSQLTLRGRGTFFALITGPNIEAAVNVPITLAPRPTGDGPTRIIDTRGTVLGGGQFADPSTLTINGAISSGAYNLQKLGPGTLTLTASSPNLANTFEVNNGIVRLGTDTSLGTATFVTSSGFPVKLVGDGGPRTLGNNFTLGGAGPLVITEPGGHAMTLTGTLSAADIKAIGVEVGTTATISGKITGTGGISKENPGTLVLSGTANDNAGGFVFGNGTVHAANDTVFGTGGAFVHNTTNNGILVAGGGPRTFANPLTLGEGGTLQFGTAAAANDITFAGPVTLSNRNADATPATGDELKPLTVATGVTATLSGVVGESNPGSGIVKAGPGALALTAANVYTGGTTVAGGTLVAGHADALPVGRGLSVADGATARAAAGLPKALDLGGLSMTAVGTTGGRLDITNNSIALRHADQAAAFAGHAAVNGLVRNAFNEFAWNQPGVTSSTVAAQVAAGIPAAVGILLNNDGAGNPLFYGDGTSLPQFDGRSVDANTVLVEDTLLGDGDLNGAVDSVDFALFQAGYTGAAPYIGFSFGDYDYNGVIDSVDFGLFQAGYQYSQSNPPTPEMVAFATEHGLSLAAATVPEPAAMGLAAVAGVRLLARRRRRQ